MRRFRSAMQHMLNPLHMYCRLKDFGIAAPAAKRMCRAYERYIYRFFP